MLNLSATFHWMCGEDRFWFRRQTRAGEDRVVIDAESGEQFVDNEVTGAPPEEPRTDCVMSPNGQSAIVRRDNDLWLLELSGTKEQRLTYDGEPNFGYGDVDPSYDRQVIARRRAQRAPPLLGVLWSPDSRFVVALRQDLRRVPERLFVTEYVSTDDVFASTDVRRIALPRDPGTLDSVLVVLDTKTLTSTLIELQSKNLSDLALHCFIRSVVWWGAQCDKLYLLSANHGGTCVALNEIELSSGKRREILCETARFNVRLNPRDYARPNVCVTSDGREVIWYSERSGYGHLYLYDARSGEISRQLTRGDWVVFDLLRVDEAQRLAYFTGATRQHKGHPYYRYLYRVSLDGGEPQLLTPEVADHEFNNLFFRGSYPFPGDGTEAPQPGSSLSPSGRYFVDAFSTINDPPEYVLRRTSGELVARVLSSDASELHASGWRPPELVVAKAADGSTDLYGVITRPRDFDSTVRYPVIDAMYPGPQGSYAPRSFSDQLSFGAMYCTQTFADAGFIVVAFDGRGTAHRSREFREAFLGTEDVFGSADHVAAIQDMAAQRSYMDLECVGVMGQSFGGYGALRAMLLHPDFFKVGASATGPAGFLDMQGQTNVERFFGVPSASVEDRVYFERLSNSRLAPHLKGPLLLIYGGIDENVPLKHAFVMFDAFIKADKDFDMLLVPDSPHGVTRDPYVIRRTLQFFVEHLAN